MKNDRPPSNGASPEDLDLAEKAHDYGVLLINLSAALGTGLGSVEQKTAEGQRLGTTRDVLACLVERIRSSSVMKAKRDAYSDEKAALLRPELQAIFKRLVNRKVRRQRARAQIESELMREIAEAVDGMEIVLTPSATTKVRQGPVAALLEGHRSPREAAIEATVIVMRPRYEVSPDAALEGGRDRVRRRSGNPHFGFNDEPKSSK